MPRCLHREAETGGFSLRWGAGESRLVEELVQWGQVQTPEEIA